MNTQLLVEQNISILSTLRNLIDQLSSEEYNATDKVYYTSSFGAHTRHIIDHYLMLLSGLDTGVIDYDRRRRDESIATKRTEAKNAIQRVIDQLLLISDTDAPLQIAQQVSVNEAAPSQVSTLGRELIFLHSHTTHHHSLMILIMRLLGKQVDASAAYAPSTLKHLQKEACAQ